MPILKNDDEQISKVRIELRDLSKSFGSLNANDSVSFHVDSGEILGLVGENGAGKSTCMNMLFGHIKPDRGTILINGQDVQFRSPKESIKAGIGMVHQHFLLAPALTALEHIELVAGRRARVDAIKAMRDLGFEFDLAARVEHLSVGQQQQLEILKVICQGARVIILDEPTAVLTPVEVQPFLERLRRLSESGHAVILISHKLDEVIRVCDRIVVMRSGRVTGIFDAASVSAESLAGSMMGEGMTGVKVKTSRPEPGTIPVLKITDYYRPDGRGSLDVSFVVNQREIVGIAGVEGNGQEWLFKVILRIAQRMRGESGSISVAGRELTSLSVQEIRRAVRIALLPFDRRSEGLLLDGDPATNLLLSGVNPASYRKISLRWISRFGILPWGILRSRAVELFSKYGILPARWTGPVRLLSGGNQQKFVVAREMEQDPALVLAAHPTRGVDFRSSRTIHEAILSARDRGAGVLLVSSDMEELCSLSDRIMVMVRGKIVREFKRAPDDGFDVSGIGNSMVSAAPGGSVGDGPGATVGGGPL